MHNPETVDDVNAIILELRARAASAVARNVHQISIENVRQAFASVGEQITNAGIPLQQHSALGSQFVVFGSPTDIWRIPGATETVQQLINSHPNVPRIRDLFEACHAAIIVMQREGNGGCMVMMAKYALQHDLEIQRAIVQFISPMFAPMIFTIVQLAVEQQSNTTLKKFIGAFKDTEVPRCAAGQSKKDIAIAALNTMQAPANQIDDLRNWEDTGDAADYNGLSAD